MRAGVRAGFLGGFRFERGNGRGWTAFGGWAAAGELDRESTGVVAGPGGVESRPERFSELNDIDITNWHIDWVGDPKNPNIRNINESE